MQHCRPTGCVVAFAACIILSCTAHAQIADLAWAKKISGVTTNNGNDSGGMIAVDASGNVYTVGSFFGTFDLDPSVLTASVTSAGAQDIFVVKFSAQGNFIWGKRVGGTGTDLVTDVDLAANGDLVLTGQFVGTVDFNPNAGTLNLAGGSTSSNGFVWRLTANGDLVWAKFWNSSAAGNDLDVADDGSIYVAGSFEATTGGVASNQLPLNLTSLGAKDACFFKLNSNGSLLWAGRVGGQPGGDYARQIHATEDGVLVAGDFWPGGFAAVVDFNPGLGTANRQGVGNLDIYVLKLDVDGNFQWVDIFGSLDYDDAKGLDLDAAGNIWLTGRFRGTMDTDPGAGVSNLVSAGTDEAYLMKLSPAGAFLWSGRMGGTGLDSGTAVQIGPDGAAYVAGLFEVQSDLDPTDGVNGFTAFGSRDGFITKVQNDGTFVWARRFGGANVDAINGITVDAFGAVYATGFFYGTVDMDPNAGEVILDTGSAGFGDAYVLKLRQCSPSTSSTSVSACGSYTIGEQTFDESGVYPVLLTSSTGCDSTVTVALTINDATASTTTASACAAYDWNGNNYGVSGTYEVTLTNSAGCDSTAVLILDVTALDNGVDAQGATLTATQAGATYQWLDCNAGNAPIDGATAQSFQAMANGSYAVEIEQGNCVVLSDCYPVISTLVGTAWKDPLSIFPIPADDHIIINGIVAGDRLVMLDAFGRSVRVDLCTGPAHHMALVGLPSGPYLLRIVGRTGDRTARILVQ